MFKSKLRWQSKRHQKNYLSLLTQVIFYTLVKWLKLSNRSKKKAKTLQEFEIFRQKSWQNHTVSSQLNSLEYIVFAYHKIRISKNKLKSKHPCIGFWVHYYLLMLQKFGDFDLKLFVETLYKTVAGIVERD